MNFSLSKAFLLLGLLSIEIKAESEIPQPILAEAKISQNSPFATKVEEILKNMKATRYQAKTEINEKKGSINCDCSGFIGYVLRTYFPESYLSLSGLESPWRKRPYSVTYYETFVTAGSRGTGNGGWKRIVKLMDVRPGDVLAWRKKLIKKGVSTGHVCMIAGMPILETNGRIRIRVIDSTNSLHANDTRPPETDGVGAGDMWFTINKKGEANGFFVNEKRTKANSNKIAIGRVLAGQNAKKTISTGKSVDNKKDILFLGLEKKKAIGLAKKLGLSWRIVIDDETINPVTMKLSDDRINFIIEKGKVIRVRRG